MNFKYFLKTTLWAKDSRKKMGERNAQLFMNREFAQLVNKQLTLPVSLCQL